MLEHNDNLPYLYICNNDIYTMHKHTIKARLVSSYQELDVRSVTDIIRTEHEAVGTYSIDQVQQMPWRKTKRQILSQLNQHIGNNR